MALNCISNRARWRLYLTMLIVVAAALGGCATGPPPADTHAGPVATDDPGFRPQSDGSAAFVETIASADVAVFPAIVRTPTQTAYSSPARQKIIAYLEQHGLGSGRPLDREFALDALQYSPQWAIFQKSLSTIAEQLSTHPIVADYAIVVEILIPTDDAAMFVFGIQVYILDNDGTNAFSFLLNSHHRLFADAQLRVAASDARGKQWLALRSTDVALAALKEQIARARSGPAESSDLRPVNELPMYGEREKTAAQLEADRRFIEDVTPRFPSREDAAEHFARRGWNHFYAGEKSLAIRRFNQSWLLDAANRHALWGFAVITLERGDLDASLRFFEMALASGPEDPRLRAQYQTVRGMKEASSIDPSR